MLTSLLFLESNYNMRAWLAKGIKSDALDQKLYVTDRGKNKGRGSAFPSAASPHHTASISSSGCAAERERADFTVAQAWDAPLRLLSSFRQAFCRASRRVPPPPKLCSPRTLSPQGEEGIWDSREGVEAEGEEKDEGKKMQEGLEVMKGRGRWRDRQMEGRGKQKASRQTLGDGGRGGRKREWLLAAHFSTHEPICTAPRVGRHRCSVWNDWASQRHQSTAGSRMQSHESRVRLLCCRKAF